MLIVSTTLVLLLVAITQGKLIPEGPTPSMSQYIETYLQLQIF